MDIRKVIEAADPLLLGILSSTPDRIRLYDTEGQLLFTNEAAQNVSIRQSESPDDPAWREVGLPQGVDQSLPARLTRVIQRKLAIRTEQVMDTPEGGQRFRETILSPVLDEAGRVVAVLNIIRDITGRREIEERFERVFRLTPDALAITRISDGTYFDVNEAFLRILGYGREEILGRTSLQLGIWTDPADRERLVAAIQDHQQINGLEANFRRKDGSVFTALMSARTAHIAGETCLISLTTDISERILMEKQIRESGERFRGLFNEAADGIFHGDSGGRILAVNPKGCELTGYSPEELIGQNLAILFSAEELRRVRFRYDDLDAGKTVVSERFLTRRNGTLLPIEMNTRRMEDKTYLSFVRDISSRLATEQQLRCEQAMLASVIDHNSYAIQLVDPEGRHLRHNQAFLDLFGAAPPAEYSVFEDPILCRTGITEGLRECLRGQRIVFPDLWYDPHEAVPEFTSRRRCLRSTAFPIQASEGEVQNLVIMHEDITEWKDAEEALRLQEEQYRTLFFTMAQGVVYQGADGQILSANPAAEHILGLSLDQMVGRTSLDSHWACIHEDGSPFPGEDHPAMVALRTGRPVHSVVMGVFHPQEGRHRWSVVSATPEFLTGQERPWRVFTTLTDITELKAAQDDQRQATQRLHGVLNNSQAVIFQLDPEGRFLLSEGRGLALLGLLPGQVVGLSALEMYRESPSTLTALKLALSGQACRALLEVRGLVFDTNLSPVMGPGGILESVIGVSTDVTDRERAQHSLQASEQKFRELLAKLGEGFGLVDAHETFTFANPAAEAIFGVGEGQLVGRSLLEFLDPDAFDQIRERTESRKAGQKETYELTIRRPNQERRQIRVNVTPIFDAKGEFVGTNGLIQDITERRTAEEALRQAQKLESLGVLAGGIAHDFNNLLTAILGNLNLAQTRLPEDSPAMPFLENAEKTVLRAADLTKQMLAYSGKGRFVVKLHDLNGLVQEMTHLLQVSIPKKTTLRFRLHPEPLPIDADGAQIHQVVMNLVTNASDAIGEGEGAITVATRLERVGPGQVPAADPGQNMAPGLCAVLEVSDSGCGMSPEVMARIFDPFFSTKAAGRGLGLSAMLGILRGHKAGLRIQSQADQGSTFSIFLPLSEASLTTQDPPPPLAKGQFRGEALVVDDEPMVREFAAQALASLGFRTSEARDGLEAVACFAQAPDRFALILLDLTMPRMDGREALVELRRLRPELPVILSSGYSDQECLQDLANETNLRFLQKPYLLANLRQTVEALLKAREA